MKNFVYVTEKTPSYSSPLEAFEAERRRIEATGFPKYVYINPQFTVMSDALTRTLIEVVQQYQSQWINRIDRTLGRHNRRLNDFATAYGERTKKDRYRSWTVIRIGVYFLNGKQVNGSAWHRFHPRHNGSAIVVRNEIPKATRRPGPNPEDTSAELDDLFISETPSSKKPRSHPNEPCKREDKSCHSHVHFDFFPEHEVQDAGTDDFYDLLLSDDFDFDQYHADLRQLGK